MLIYAKILILKSQVIIVIMGFASQNIIMEALCNYIKYKSVFDFCTASYVFFYNRYGDEEYEY